MGKQATKSAKSHKVASSRLDAMSLPSFDERSLSSLTDKIELGFRNAAASKKESQPKQDIVSSMKSEAQSQKPRKFRDETGQPFKGKKRDADGNIKERVNGNSGIKRAKRLEDKDGNKEDRDILLQEILALGGTEEDLDLIDGLDSDQGDVRSDTLQSVTVDAKFRKELSNFVGGLGIKEMADEDSYESNSEGLGTEDWEDDSNKPTPDTGVSVVNTTILQKEKSSLSRQKDLNRLMFEARPDWHAAALPELPNPDLSGSAIRLGLFAALKRNALSLLEKDNDLYASKHLSSTSSHRFLSTIMSSGTLSDKVSALTLVIQESPLHTMKSFESLLALAKKRSRGQAVTALGAVKDLLGVGTLLPSDRRLRTFENQPGLLGTLQAYPVPPDWKAGERLPGRIINAHLISWAYEDWIKEAYFEVLKLLEGWCNDEVEFARGRAVTYVYELLREKPEQESNLLRLLVNKLGDPEKKIASRTSYLILQLETTHPLMKPIIVRSIESELLLRPGQTAHAKYYAINTLNQTILSGKEEDVARKLLSIYFDIFVTLLKKADPPGVVAGPVINRKGQVQGGGGQMGKKAKDKAKKQDLAKQLSEETTEKMISAVLSGVNRALPFAQSDDFTLEKHMDMLFKITHSSNFNTSIQALMLIQQLAASKHIAEDRFYRTLYESLLDPRLITSSKHAMYLNLLFGSLKADLNVRRVKAFAKRLLQVITLHQPPFICGVLHLLHELQGTFPGLSSLLKDPEEWDEVDEVFLDMPDGPVEDAAAEISQVDFRHPDRSHNTEMTRSGYDGRKRDPEHSNADKSCLWELLPFITHFHPSVSMFASCLLHNKEISVKPDLASHTLIHFLDRFVYRNARAAAGGLRGSSIMQPLAGGESQGLLVSNRLLQKNHDSVNSESFWRKNAKDVAVDEVFFHRYFSQVGKGKRSSSKKNKSSSAADDASSQKDGGENEDEIWQALVESQPGVEGISEDEDDMHMLDLDDSQNDSSGASGVEVESEDDGVDFEDFDEAASHISENSKVSMDDYKIALSSRENLFAQNLKKKGVTKDAAERKKSSRDRRRILKNLPTFASTEEYAEMLQDDDEGI